MPSIAVMPFANLSSDAENEHFADGLTDELMHALTAIEGLRVAGRTSSFQFKGKADDPRRIGQLLRVGTLVEGGVRRDGNRLLVTAQLVSCDDGFQLWSGRFQRELKDIFAIQQEIGDAIADALRIRFSNSARRQLAWHSTEDLTAYRSPGLRSTIRRTGAGGSKRCSGPTARDRSAARSGAIIGPGCP